MKKAAIRNRRLWEPGAVLKLVALLCVIGLAVNGQDNPRRTKIRFEVDGKPALAKEIEFYDEVGHLLARRGVTDGFFEAPALEPSDKVDVHIVLGGRTLVFQEIYGTKFECEWTVGIDTPPFSSERAWTIPKNTKPKEIWFIKFDSREGDGTVVAVFVK